MFLVVEGEPRDSGVSMLHRDSESRPSSSEIDTDDEVEAVRRVRHTMLIS